MFIYLSLVLLSINGLTQASVDMSKICANHTLGQILPHPEDCSAYIVCELHATTHYCQRGLHFDAKQNVCNWPQFANCKLETKPHNGSNGGPKVGNDTGPDAGLDSKPSAADHNLQAMVAIDASTGNAIDPMTHYNLLAVSCLYFGAYFLPHPLSCRTFYLCAYGHMHQLECGLGSMWNFQTQQCEISVLAQCYQTTEEERHEISVMENQWFTSGPTTTDGLPTNTFNPTGSYHGATATGTTKAMETSSSTSKYTTTSTLAPTTADGETSRNFHPTGSIYTATATATTAAIASSDGGDVTSPYPPTGTFHPTGSIYSATATATTEANGQTTNSFHPTGSYHTATGKGSTAALGTSSEADVTSSYPTSGTFHLTGSIYTATRTTAKSSRPKTTSGTSSKPTTPLPSKAAHSSQPFFLECPEQIQSYIADPRDCSKYYMCIQGMPIQTQCPNGLLWDAKKSFCALPKFVKCFQ